MDPKTYQLAMENLNLSQRVYDALAGSLRVPLGPLPVPLRSEIEADEDEEKASQTCLILSNRRLGMILDHMPVAPCQRRHVGDPIPPAPEG